MTHRFSEFVDIEKLKQTCEMFSSLTGFTVGLGGNPMQEILFLTGARDCCKHFHRSFPESMKACIESNKELARDLKEGDIKIKRCESGLIDGVTPVVIDGEHIANLFTGQVFFEQPDIDYFIMQAEKYGYDKDKYIQAIKIVPVVTEEHFKNALNYLRSIAMWITEMGVINKKLKLHEEELSKRNEDMYLRQKAILDNIPDMAWLKDLDSRFVAVNPALATGFGHSAEEIIGKTDYEFVPRETAESYRNDDLEVIKTGERKSIEEPFFISDYKQIIIETLKTPIRNYKGEVIGTAGIARDITERKEIEIALRESEIRFRGLFNNISCGVVVYDIQNNGKDIIISDFNKTSEKIEKMSRDEVIGKKVDDIFPGVKKFGLYDIFLEVWRTGKPVFHPCTFYEDNRVSGYRENYIYKLPSGEVVAAYDDITDSVKTEKIKSNFIATLSHDLRVPLLAENKALKYLLKGSYGALTERQVEAVTNMLQSNEDLLNLVNNLLDVYKYDSSTIEIVKDDVQVCQILKECIAELMPLIEDHKNNLTCNAEEPGYTIKGDKRQLKRVLINIISNAIDYSSESSDIKISVERKDKFVKIIIEDNGQGISESEIDKIFDLYYTSSKKFRKVGTGLGLYLSKQIINAHEGDIGVESVLGQGSVFWITLPVE